MKINFIILKTDICASNTSIRTALTKRFDNKKHVNNLKPNTQSYLRRGET